jgi:predicted restriction endonuclease
MEFQKLDKIYTYIKNDELDQLITFNSQDIDLVIEMRFPNKILETKKRLCDYRIHSKQFRNKTINKFKVCAITGISHSICEAAHILPYSKCKDFEKDDEFNSILLSANMHKSFDKNYFTIDSDTCKIKILFDNIIKDNINSLSSLDIECINGKYIQELDNARSKNYIKCRNIIYS